MSNENISEKHIQSRIQDSKKNYDSKLNSIIVSNRQQKSAIVKQVEKTNVKRIWLFLIFRSKNYFFLSGEKLKF